MNKQKTYTLYAKIYGSKEPEYTLDEMIHSSEKEQKRGLMLMSRERIEDLDRLTDDYLSEEDLLLSYTEEVYGKKVPLYDPVIIVDKHPTDRSKSYAIFDIVFADDREALKDKENIRMWLLDYLKNNPEDISKFRGIKDIYENLKNKYGKSNEEYLINTTVLIYLEEDNYKRYREAYFTLKKLESQKVNKTR